MIKFRTGDIVQLKSGGPKMTVDIDDAIDAIAHTNKVHCQWFAGSKLERGWFAADSLIKVEEEEEKRKK